LDATTGGWAPSGGASQITKKVNSAIRKVAARVVLDSLALLSSRPGVAARLIGATAESKHGGDVVRYQPAVAEPAVVVMTDAFVTERRKIAKDIRSVAAARWSQWSVKSAKDPVAAKAERQAKKKFMTLVGKEEACRGEKHFYTFENFVRHIGEVS
jgi:hypothetical protein